MKTLAIGMLFAAALVSVAGCHWRHRNWRDNRNYSYDSYHNGDHYVRNQRASVVDRDS
jgi:hypothetical protein